MTHELDFLVATGNDFQETNKPGITLGMNVLAETEFISVIKR